MKKLSLTLLTLLMVGVAMAQTKSVSILGDSYSTYEGFMTPSTNELWYYGKNGDKKTDVKNVRQTWWHEVISENGWRLCINNSYSGATVSYTGYDGNDYSARSSSYSAPPTTAGQEHPSVNTNMTTSPTATYTSSVPHWHVCFSG